MNMINYCISGRILLSARSRSVHGVTAPSGTRRSPTTMDAAHGGASSASTLAQARRCARKGFTLAEVALALMVVSVGLLAVFSLFPAGLAVNKEAVDDTQAILFADEVLNGYKAQVAATPWAQIQNIVVQPRNPQLWGAGDAIRPRQTDTWQLARFIPAGMENDPQVLRYRFFVDVLDNRAAVRIEVVAGELGSTAKPVRVYTEIFNTARPTS